jgi:serralysin
MSYFAGSATGQTPGNFASAYTPMLLDIYELQMLYGVNTSTRLGDTVYGFNSTAGVNYDFAGIASPQFCIWDAGGAQDVLDCSGYSGAQNISLAPGTFSSVDGAVNNVSIAIGCIIEKAIGGSGADTFVGGKGANTLVGNAGADIFAYLTAADSTAAARDVINDFVKGQDKIDLSGIDARTATAAVNDAFSATLLASSGNFTAAGQLRYFLSNGQTIVEGNTDTVFSTAEFSIALIGNYTAGLTQLAASDFVL